ncbi:MAG: SdiA-regulated domain-containing protein [Gammaproteobacteria bacterium]|nr:SdiA-regulated domain-containing protein [Gammaproteobacteria bacterium]
MSFAYNMQHADNSYTLDKILDEISGIHVIKNNNIACIHDENRDIFELTKGKISAHFKSGKKDDIEDIVLIKNTVYMLDAKKCMIYEYKNFKHSMKHYKTYPLHLNKNSDPEGLCYDKHNQCLLVACKNGKKTIREIFQFDLKKKKLNKKVYFTINAKKLSGSSSKKTFNPSGIAIHPKTREIYIISSQDLKMIIRLNKTGTKILSQKKLVATQFRQPEGITFSSKGDLYISSEAKNNKSAKLFRFKAH